MEGLEQDLLVLTRKFLQDSGADRASRSVTMQASLERELGIGSLEKAELFHRIEQHFKIKLPEKLLAEAKNLQEIHDTISTLPQIKKFNYGETQKISLSASVVDPHKAKTINEILKLYREQDENRPYVYLQKEDGEEIITYGELFEKANQLAQGLAGYGVVPGDTVSIMLPTSSEFLYAFYGTLLAGAIPVPIYPPMRMDQIEEYANKEAIILRNAGIKILISFKEANKLNKLLKPFIPSLLHVLDVETIMQREGKLKGVDVEADDIALLQYTSGSTGNPKGVILTHRALLANIHAYGEGSKPTPNDVFVSWLPLYHDMGLIGAVMGSLFYGIPLILMSPLTFLSRPEKWLWTIHYRRGTLSPAPNFAYELCGKIRDEDIEGMDLSCWRLALNGAEAVYPATMDKFSRKFAKHGFKKSSFFPAYGLAESSVALVFPPLNREPVVDRIDRKIFETEQKAVPAQQDNACYEFVSCGSVLPGHEIRIVDDHDQLLPAREIGNLQFRGPSSLQGYYRNPEATEAIYHDGWWATGDLGYLAKNELYITGRKKDVIIKAGRNYYPPEIEDAACEVPGVRRGCAAAFGVLDQTTGTEKLIVVAEKSRGMSVSNNEIIDGIREKVASVIDIPPDQVILVEPRTIPKTSSGKLRRSSCKQLYLDGKLSKGAKSTRLQIASLFLRAVGKTLLKWGRNVLKSIYTFYMAIIMLITLLPVRLVTFMLSQRHSNLLFKAWAKTIIFFGFSPYGLAGKEFLPEKNPKIYVANHSSYLDALYLMAVLPLCTRFVGKKELLKVPMVGGIMKKLGHIFVDRLDITKNESDLKKITDEINNGYSILFFPEGTFTHVAGVRPFKSGPFKLAADLNIPVCPIALTHTREILRAHEFLLKPHRVKIVITGLMYAKDQQWASIVGLRDWSRTEIAKHCGEQTIDLIVAGPEKT